MQGGLDHRISHYQRVWDCGCVTASNDKITEAGQCGIYESGNDEYGIWYKGYNLDQCSEFVNTNKNQYPEELKRYRHNNAPTSQMRCQKSPNIGIVTANQLQREMQGQSASPSPTRKSPVASNQPPRPKSPNTGLVTASQLQQKINNGQVKPNRPALAPQQAVKVITMPQIVIEVWQANGSDLFYRSQLVELLQQYGFDADNVSTRSGLDHQISHYKRCWTYGVATTTNPDNITQPETCGIWDSGRDEYGVWYRGYLLQECPGFVNANKNLLYPEELKRYRNQPQAAPVPTPATPKPAKRQLPEKPDWAEKQRPDGCVLYQGNWYDISTGKAVIVQ
jgi:hypothetical protein